MSAMNGRERILAHLAGRPVDRLPFIPTTMMFAADHIGVPYLEYCLDHRRRVAAQMSVAAAYGFDFVTVISDPTREAADLGAAIRYFPDQPPGFDEQQALLADKARLARLRVPDPATGPRMNDQLHAPADLKAQAADAYLVEGWIQGPCAEGADLRGINTLLVDFYDDPA